MDRKKFGQIITHKGEKYLRWQKVSFSNHNAPMLLEIGVAKNNGNGRIPVGSLQIAVCANA